MYNFNVFNFYSTIFFWWVDYFIIIFNDDLLSTTSNSTYSYADDNLLNDNFQLSQPPSYPELNRNRKTTCTNPSKQKSWSGKQNRSENIHHVFMNGLIIENKESFNHVVVTFKSSLNWHEHVTTIASCAKRKLGFRLQARKNPSSANLYPLCVTQIRPDFKYWATAPTSNHLLDTIQNKVIEIIGDPVFSSKPPPLDQLRAGGGLSFFYWYVHEFCFQDLL